MNFIKGMDISFLTELLERGACFHDKEGNRREIFELLKENGVNSIRLRIWNEPENVPESKGYCSLKHTIAMAKKIKENDMSFFLDFHYSDFWADPGKQEKPKAFKELDKEELIQAVYEYTKQVLNTLKEEGVLPDLVQIGNEIRSGMLFPDGEVPDYYGLVQLVNAGIRAVREFAGVQVVIHLDQGGRYHYLRDWFDAAISQGLDEFDIMGLSYYPFWHGTFAELKESMVQLVKRYQKPIIIAETAHAWRKTKDGFIGEQQEKIAGFPATPEGQRKVLELVMSITASLEEDMGLGIYYWEPVVIPEEGIPGWSSNMGIFDEEAKALPALECFRFTKSKEEIINPVKIYKPEPIVVKLGDVTQLPKLIQVLYSDGSVTKLPVWWEEYNTEKAGEILVRGWVNELSEKVSITLSVMENLIKDYNFIPNGSFENGLTGWQIQKSDARVLAELRPDFIDPFPAPPEHYFYIESPMNFEFCMHKTIEGIKNGEYVLKVEYMGSNTTGVDVKIYAKTDENSAKEAIIYPTDENWVTYELSNIIIEKRKVEVGIKLMSPPVFGKIRRFSLIKMSGRHI
jgi:arabinogalactan endo-1,4-beta-galactosidase